jgi:DnaJ-class molecular chaperone
VLNENGTCDVFGKQTIASLLSSTKTEADDWIQVLSDYQLRGLVHEMGQRLLESSQMYQSRLSQWENLSEKANLAFFGLSANATDRELDVAYRQLSKKMHPDKNGGTEESKQRFQEMKTRYEALKKKRGSQDSDEQVKEEEKQEDEQTDKDDRTIEFDPTSRDSLFNTAKKMLSQLSTLDTSMATLVEQLQRHGL